MHLADEAAAIAAMGGGSDAGHELHVGGGGATVGEWAVASGMGQYEELLASLGYSGDLGALTSPPLADNDIQMIAGSAMEAGMAQEHAQVRSGHVFEVVPGPVQHTPRSHCIKC